MRSMGFRGFFASVLVVGGLAACGEANFGDTGGFGPGDGNGVSVSSLTLLASTTSLASDAIDDVGGIVITAIVVDANNNAVPGVPVTFAASSGALIVDDPVTGSDGKATAILTTGGDPSLRTIQVAAVAGDKQDSVSIAVIQAPSPPDVRFGVSNGGSFTPGVIEIGQSPLAAGGSSGLRVDFVDVANGNSLFNTPSTVTFTSPCVSQGLATITSPVESAGGTANATYQALGCAGNDLITATTTVNGNNLIATGTIAVTQAALGGIEFVSATPTTIGVRGTGLPETSTVIFRVRNASGGPIANLPVTFTLNTTVGGIQLTPTTGTTNAQGIVQTVVRAGTIHTAVRVTATATQDGDTISSQSELLVITTGIPDQDSVSLAVEKFNPAAFNCDGVIDTLTVRAADRFNNPVPDGTAFAFTTEGGSIAGSCQTDNGVCTADWVSQDPRPTNGRVTVLVTAIGEESFVDSNGNGIFDDGEVFEDLPEAFVDKNEDDVRQANEEFLDFNLDGAYSPKNDLFSGVLCAAGAACDPKKSVHVRDSLVIVMSSQHPVIVSTSPSFPLVTEDDTSMVISFVVKDINGQTLPIGTSVTLEAPTGVTIDGTATYTVPNTNDASDAGNTYSFSIKTQNDLFIDGLLKLKISAPGDCGTLLTEFAFPIRSNTQCTDGVNNDLTVPGVNFDGTALNKGDTFVDEADRGCYDDSGTFNPNDDSELSQCQNGSDDDDAEGIDAVDPDCHQHIDANGDGDFSDPGDLIYGDFDPQIDVEASSAVKRLLLKAMPRTKESLLAPSRR